MRRSVGSNQYHTRTSDVLDAVMGPDLMMQAAAGVPSQQQRCGDVWGTKCRAWVSPPDFTHGQHGLAGNLELLAQDPDCPSWVLPILAQDDDPGVRCAVAANPQLGINEARRLAADQDPEVRAQAVSHPVCADAHDVLLAGSLDPDFRVRLATLLVPKLPSDVVASLIQDQEAMVRRAAVLHPSCTPAMQIKAVQVDNEQTDVTTCLMQQPHLHESVLRAILELADGVDYRVASHPNCPLDLYERLAHSSNAVARDVSLRHLPVGHDLVLHAARKGNAGCLIENIQHGWLYPQQVFVAIWNTSPDSEQRRRLLTNPACPPSVLRLACKDQAAAVVMEAVRHPACPTTEINNIVKRMLRARDGFYGDTNKILAQMVLSHPGCTPDVLQLVYDEQVAEVDLTTPGSGTHVGSILAGITANPRCPPSIMNNTLRLYQLGIRHCSTAMRYVLSNPNCPPDMLHSAAMYDGDRELVTFQRLALTSNPNCPPDILVQLIGDSVNAVRNEALQHPNCPPEYQTLAQIT